MKIAWSRCFVIINVMNKGGAPNNGSVLQHPIGFEVSPILYVKQVSREICKDLPIDLQEGLALFGKTYFSKLDHASTQFESHWSQATASRRGERI